MEPIYSETLNISIRLRISYWLMCKWIKDRGNGLLSNMMDDETKQQILAQKNCLNQKSCCKMPKCPYYNDFISVSHFQQCVGTSREHNKALNRWSLEKQTENILRGSGNGETIQHELSCLSGQPGCGLHAIHCLVPWKGWGIMNVRALSL